MDETEINFAAVENSDRFLRLQVSTHQERDQIHFELFTASMGTVSINSSGTRGQRPNKWQAKILRVYKCLKTLSRVKKDTTRMCHY